jgi:hypothetical protein
VNAGLFGFPSRNDLLLQSIVEFDSSGSYVIPRSSVALTIMAVAGGGGGGGGQLRATSTNTNGGGGGSTGSLNVLTFATWGFLDMGYTSLQVTIGAGGTAGAGATVAGGNGNNGGVGGDTQVLVPSLRGQLIWVVGGAGGSNVGSSGGNSLAYFDGASSSFRIGGSGTASNTQYSTWWLSGSGTGGGQVNAGNTESAGGNIIAPANNSSLPANPFFARTATMLAGGAAGSNNGVNGISAVGSVWLGMRYGPGFGGTGGGGSNTANGGRGGDGHRGGGGGGGGAAKNGFVAGSGGKGGDGYVCIWAWG